MREILFKAKRLDSGEWVEGYYVRRAMRLVDEHGCLCPTYSHRIYRTDEGKQSFCAVDPETVCQYTGLTDKNDVKIFEGDVIKIHNTNRQGLPAPVFYKQQDCTFVIHRSGYNPIPMDDYWAEKDFEVIGNIHDKEK